MKRTGTGQRVLDFKINTQACDRPVRTTWQTGEDTKPQYLRLRLCELGPDFCPSCGLCAFGRAYVANTMRKNKTPVRA